MAVQGGGTTGTGLKLVGADVAPKSPGLINSARNWWGGLDKTEKFLTTQVGMQGLGTGLQAYGANQQVKEQRQLEADARDRYNTNVGTRLWG